MKTAFLMTALTVLLVLVGDYFGGLQGMLVMLVFSVGMNFFAYWNSDKMVLRHYNAREVDAHSAPALYNFIKWCRIWHAAAICRCRRFILSTAPCRTLLQPAATLSTQQLP